MLLPLDFQKTGDFTHLRLPIADCRFQVTQLPNYQFTP